MEIRPSDLIQLKKDIERVRKHEAERKARAADENLENISDETRKAAVSDSAKSSVSVSARLRELVETFWGPPTPSKESVETIPDYLITLLQVIGEEPKFRKWLLQLKGMPADHRNSATGQNGLRLPDRRR